MRTLREVLVATCSASGVSIAAVNSHRRRNQGRLAMSKVARMRWGALLLGIVAHTQGRAWTLVRCKPGNGLLGAGFTSSKIPAGCRTALVVSLLLAAAPAWSAAGRTPGRFDVSATGEAQYSIPIFAPPGINGLTPQLALTYGHRYEGTLAGVGWGVSGLSAIHRCESRGRKTVWRARRRTRSATATVSMVCSCDWFQATYVSVRVDVHRTEIETFARITASGSAGNGPASFKSS